MSNKLGQESAFAALAIDKSIKVDEQTTEYFIVGNNGMSKRFYAACAAMQGILASGATVEGKREISPKLVTLYAYQFADELLKQENA